MKHAVKHIPFVETVTHADEAVRGLRRVWA